MPPMMCDFCKSRPARARVTQREDNGELTRFYACRECANALSYGVISIASAMESGAKVQAAPAEAVEESGGETTCPACGLSYKAFRESMKFGCGRAMGRSGELPALLSQVQAGRHVGKVPPRIRSVLDLEKGIADLRAQIKAAVGREDFARAAQLRDKVRGLERRRDEALAGRRGASTPPKGERQDESPPLTRGEGGDSG
ncbi:UvrB/UvrC motif-containing protein [bacterium]|nr:UvrB/UvrC motif-containing protein [bacterium]